eukprot:8616780-Pyramimonas_sp.AAC.1
MAGPLVLGPSCSTSAPRAVRLSLRCHCDFVAPGGARVAMWGSDVGPEPGSDAKKYGRKVMKAWRANFYRRLQAHAVRALSSPPPRAVLRSP